MNLLIIGYSVVDKIESKGTSVIKPGGIFYTVLGLTSLKKDEDKLTLVTASDKANHNLFSDLFRNCKSIHYSNVDNLPSVILKIYEDKEREEIYENIASPLLIRIENFNEFDGILINMITGFDITLETFNRIRKNYKGTIYFDVHTMTRGLTKSMKLEFRQIENFNEWAECIDVLQANQLEAQTLFGDLNEYETARKALNHGVKIFIITKAEEGARIFYKEKNEIVSIFRPALHVKVQNKVGLGDIFGAAFFYIYVKSKNIVEALDTAVKAAGKAASYYNIDDYKKLKYDVFSRYN